MPRLSVLALLLLSAAGLCSCERTFEIVGDQFLKDGNPFRFIAGDIHYHRIHPDSWDDRLARVRAAGLNAIQTYVPWNLHEPFEGKFTFEGFANVFRFLEMAQSHNLSVLLRPGPYIAAEWEHGGLPYWLLKKQGIVIRHYNTQFLSAVDKFYKVLLPKVKPYLYQNGGPVIMVQVENGYGAFSEDQPYLNAVKGFYRQHLGNDIVLFTSDRSVESAQANGKIDGVLNTVTFTPVSDAQVAINFALARNYSNNGPAVCSEFYPGRPSRWGNNREYLPIPTSEEIVNASRAVYNQNGSFAIYMFHGGTNFGFYNGKQAFGVTTTSYDFIAPLSEAGDITPSYTAIRDWIGTLEGWSHAPLPVPADNPSQAYGEVKVDKVHPLVKGLAKSFKNCKVSDQPLSFEKLDIPYGYVVYRTKLTVGGTVLSAPNLKDYAYIYLNDKKQGLYIQSNASSTTIEQAQPGDELIIVVENLGRLSAIPIFESKGLFSNVTLDGTVLHNWFQCGIDFGRLPTLTFLDHLLQHVFNPHGPESADRSGVYYGSFDISGPIVDTWFNPRGFQKGQVFVNGFNVGRYWGLGPQVTLYVPAPLLKRKNSVVIIELIGNTDDTDDKVIEFGSEAVYKDIA